jgi:MFS transporter, ACS family, tartrate transporter
MCIDEEAAAVSTTVPKSDLEISTIRLVTWRIVPFLMFCYFIAFVDRVNVGFAALQMNQDVGLSASAYGLGGGLFYLTYVIFEIPSNIAMEKVGARIWIARILITWGLVSACMSLVVGPYSFYAIRLLLGAAEAGFFPGVILYLTYWFPREYRGGIIAIFMIAIPISSFLGSPISAALLQTDGWLGLRGWQLMFLLEATPAVLLGVMALIYLPNGPDRAKWLTAEQRTWLSQRLAAERTAPGRAAAPHLSLWQVMSNKYVLAASLIYAGASGSSQVLSLWQPQIIKSFGATNMQTGLLNAIPFGIASVLMVIWGRSSDARRERVWHTGIPLALLAGSLVAATMITTLLPTMLILCVAVTATYTVKGPFWALATEWLSVGAAAAGIAQINAIGNVGGLLGTSLLGVIKDATGSYPLGLLPLALISGIGCWLVLSLGRAPQALPASTPAE